MRQIPDYLVLLISAGLFSCACNPPLTYAGTAQIQLANHSLKMFAGPCSCGPGAVFNMHFSTYYTEEPWQANLEIAPRPEGSPTTHWSYTILEDISMWASVSYAQINLPVDDANGNGVADFFEKSREVSTGTTGTYQIDWGSGTLEFNWNRSAGSVGGGCVLYMVDRILGRMGPFNHNFELVQYEGSLIYQRAATNGSGTISAQGNNRSLVGPVQLIRSASDPLNTVILQAGTWNSGGEVFSFEETTLVRNSANPFIYRGTLRNTSGNFGAWTIWITDPNDTDKDGIPDLSDDMALPPPRRPELSLRRKGTQLELRIGGDVGRVHEVQSASSPVVSTWDIISTVTLTNDPQVVQVAVPATGPRFWRVMVK